MLIGSAAFGQSGLGLLGEGVVGYLGAVGAAYAASLAYVKDKERELGDLRTSTSTALDGSGVGERELIRATERLLPGTSWTTYEAPTVIRYERGQKLAPHFDANRGAAVEDANRGGQTLVTLLVYLNDVDEVRGGGQTVFGRLGEPRRATGERTRLGVLSGERRRRVRRPRRARGHGSERREMDRAHLGAPKRGRRTPERFARRLER